MKELRERKDRRSERKANPSLLTISIANLQSVLGLSVRTQSAVDLTGVESSGAVEPTAAQAIPLAVRVLYASVGRDLRDWTRTITDRTLD